MCAQIFRIVHTFVIQEHVCPTSQHTECYGLCVLSQQISLSDSSQGQIAGHVPAQLLVPSLKEPDCYRDGQHHDRWTAVVLKIQSTREKSFKF